MHPFFFAFNAWLTVGYQKTNACLRPRSPSCWPLSKQSLYKKQKQELVKTGNSRRFRRFHLGVTGIFSVHRLGGAMSRMTGFLVPIWIWKVYLALLFSLAKTLWERLSPGAVNTLSMWLLSNMFR